MEEQHPFKVMVGGSSPPGLTESDSASLRMTKAKLDLAIMYSLSLKDLRLYTGSTSDLVSRLKKVLKHTLLRLGYRYL